ncbi:MAG: lipid II flippase MurJ [Patescibacteria group bacterium]
MINKLKTIFTNKSYFNILLISSLLIISKGFGFIRTALIGSSYIENTKISYSDVFLNAQKIQDILISILIMGTFISTLIPSGSKILKEKNVEYLDKYIQWYLITVTSFFFLLSVVCALFVGPILQKFQPGPYNSYLTSEIFENYIFAARLMCFGFIFFAINTILLVYLNLRNSFFWNNLSGIVTNIVLIVVLLNFKPDFVIPLSFAVLGSIALNTILHIYGVYKLGFRIRIRTFNEYKNFYKSNKELILSDAKQLFSRTLLIPLALIASALITYYGTKDRPTFFETASNIQGIFLAFISAVGAVVLPKLSMFSTEDSSVTFIKRINQYTKKFLPFAIVGTVVTFISAKFLVSLVLSVNNFRKGVFRFDFEAPGFDLQVMMVQILSCAILFLAINEILVKYYLVQNKIRKLLVFNSIAISILVFGVSWSVKHTNFDLGLIICFFTTLSTAVLTGLFYIGIIFDKKKLTN